MPKPSQSRSSVIELQKLLHDDKNSVLDILRLAKTISSELEIENFERFAQLELSGYDDIMVEKIPKHRFFSAKFKEELGILETHIESKIIKHSFFKEPIAIIEDDFQQMVKNNKQFCYQHCTKEENDILRAESKRNTDYLRVYPRHEYLRTIQSVKNIIQDWASKLKKMNILGDNLMFSGEDKEKAQSIHFHNSIVGVVGNPIESTITQNINNGIVKGNFGSLGKFLIESGLPKEDVEYLKNIDRGEKDNPTGLRAKIFTWLGNLGTKIEDATMTVVTKAVLKYYDLLGQ